MRYLRLIRKFAGFAALSNFQNVNPPNALKELLETYKPKEEEEVKFDMTFAQVVKTQPFFIEVNHTSDNLIGMVKRCPEIFKGTWCYKDTADKKCHYWCNGPKIERAALRYKYQTGLIMQIRNKFRELYKIKD